MIQSEIYSLSRHTELGYDSYKISSFGKICKGDNEPVELQVTSLGQQHFATTNNMYFVADLVIETFFTEITDNPLHIYGEMPMYLVEHIDGDKTNNPVSNLRQLTIYKYVKLHLIHMNFKNN